MGQPVIRIAQVLGKFASGGVEAVVCNYYRFIDHSKVQFDFIIDSDSTMDIPQDIIESGAGVFKIPPYQKPFAYHKALVKLFKEQKYSIVHSHINTLNLFPLFAAWRAKIPVRICHNHSTVSKGEGKKALLKYILRPFNKIFPTDYYACGENAARWMFGKSCFNKGKVTVLNNAIDIKKFGFSREIRDRVREELNISDKFVVGHVGRFMYQKNHTFMIDIFAEVHKRNPNAVLLLIGEGKLEDEIRSKVEALGLTSSVIFYGVSCKVWELYQAFDVFVLPSFFEGLPLVAVEAMTSGVKTICSEAVPTEAKITDDFIYRTLNQPASEWAEAILQFENGYDRKDASEIIAKAGFDIATNAKRLEDFYLNRLK